MILDVSMPGRSGLGVLKDLSKVRPKPPVLVLSMYPEDQLGKRVLKAGVSGYMNKESAPEELIKAIRKVLAGGLYVSPALAEKLALDLREDAARPFHEVRGPPSPRGPGGRGLFAQQLRPSPLGPLGGWSRPPGPGEGMPIRHRTYQVPY